MFSEKTMTTEEKILEIVTKLQEETKRIGEITKEIKKNQEKLETRMSNLERNQKEFERNLSKTKEAIIKGQTGLAYLENKNHEAEVKAVNNQHEKTRLASATGQGENKKQILKVAEGTNEIRKLEERNKGYFAQIQKKVEVSNQTA